MSWVVLGLGQCTARIHIHVAAADGQTRLAADWVGVADRARKLHKPKAARAYGAQL